MCPKRLRCFVVECNNEHSSSHLHLTSELLRMQRIMFVFEGKFIPDPASPTEEVGICIFFF